MALIYRIYPVSDHVRAQPINFLDHVIQGFIHLLRGKITIELYTPLILLQVIAKSVKLVFDIAEIKFDHIITFAGGFRKKAIQIQGSILAQKTFLTNQTSGNIRIYLVPQLCTSCFLPLLEHLIHVTASEKYLHASPPPV